MAEIALVASMFGLASFGTKVATILYEAADILIHAHQQIASMAKHVSQFTTILRHLGRVLEAEKGSCSGDLLGEIRKIKRSCKTTFKEIHATIQSKTYRPFVPVRWLFRSSKARELEARLDSEQSILQVMIHTITVSKSGDMHLKNVRRKPTQGDHSSSDLSSPSQQVSCTDDWSDNGVNGGGHLPPKAGNPCMFKAYDPSDSQRPMPSAPAWVPAFETSHVRTVDVWKSTDAFGSTPSRYLGHSILKALGHTSGGIVYMKRSNLQYAVFVDDLEIYRLNLVPSSLITPKESLILATEIGKGWVCQEALDLLGYLYSEILSGKVSIPRNLYFSEIKELVRLSYQGFSRGLEVRSRQIIEERGWHEVVVSKQEIPVYSIRQPQSPNTWNEWRLPDARTPGSDVEHRINDFSNDYIQRRGPASKPQNGPLPTEFRSTTSKNGPIKVEQKADQKLAAAEIRFTMPHAPTVRRPNNRNSRREFRRAEEKLDSHSERRDKTLAVSEHNIKPFLEEDIIFYSKPKSKRPKRVQRKDGNSDHAEKRHCVPHTLVETDEE